MSVFSNKAEGRLLNRRAFLSAGSASLAWLGVGSFPRKAFGQEAPSKQELQLSRSVRALAFDVFGTVVDWRSSIIREGQLLTKTKGLPVDWAKFADAWRDGYGPAMNRVRKREIPWTNIDGLHRLILNDLLKTFAIQGLSEEEIEPQPRVAQVDALAGLCGRSEPTALPLHLGNAVERQHVSPGEHGQKRGPAVGLRAIRRAFGPLQAGPRGIRNGSTVTRFVTKPGDDGRCASG